MKATEVLESDGVSTYDSQTVWLETKLDNGNKNDSRIYTDAIFQYVTSASAVRNASLATLVDVTHQDYKSFFYVVKNGLGPLRDGSEKEAEIFYNYYVDKTNSYNTLFLVIMIVGIIVLIISELILIPIVFSVHKTNNRVLSLFGYIPTNEIDELAAKCEEYMEKYLEDHKERRDYSFEASDDEQVELSNRVDNVESSYLEVSQHQDLGGGNDVSQNISINLDVSEKIRGNPMTLFNNGKTDPLKDSLQVPAQLAANNAKQNVNGKNGVPSSSVALSQEKSHVSLATSNLDPLLYSKQLGERNPNHGREEEKKKDDAELEAELAYTKSQKLLNSKDNRRSKVMIQFIGLACLFGVYFLISYLWVEKAFINNTKKNLQHLKLSAQRMSEIRYLLVFTLEEIAEANEAEVYDFVSKLLLVN